MLTFSLTHLLQHQIRCENTKDNGEYNVLNLNLVTSAHSSKNTLSNSSKCLIVESQTSGMEMKCVGGSFFLADSTTISILDFADKTLLLSFPLITTK